MFDFIGTGPLLVIVTVVILALLASFVAGRYKVAGANEALIVAGSRGAKVRTETGDLVTAGTGVDRGIRVVVGGGTFVMPLIHKAGKLKLVARQIPVSLPDAVTSQGLKVKVEGVATFKIGRDVESIRLAAERFLDASDDEIDSIVRNILEGSLRAIVGTLTIEDLISDRQKLLQQVADAAKGDLATSGLEIDSFTIQSINDVVSTGQVSYIEQLGAQKLAIVQRDAAIAKARAEQESAVAAAEAQKIQITAQRDQALVQAEADVQTAAAQARAEQAEPLARAQATQEVTRTESDLAQLRAELRERELLAQVVKPAEAEALAAARRAEGEKNAAIRAAEAEAEQIRLQGAAQADAVRARGEAEASALALRAQAFRQFNEAALIQTVLAELPKIVAAAAEPMRGIDNLTILSTDGASEVVKNGTRTVLEASTAVKGITGIDLPTLLSGAFGRHTPSANGTDGEGEAPPAAPAPPAPPAPPPAPTEEPPTQPVATAVPPPPPSSAASEALASSRAAMESAAATVIAEGTRLAGALLRGITDVDRYRDLTLDQLATQAPGRIRQPLARLRSQLPDAVGAMTVGDILDRTSRA